MTKRWIGDDGWPHDLTNELIEALRTIPGSEKLASTQIYDMVHLLFSVACQARDEEILPRNRPASQSVSAKELKKLHNLCDLLASHIEEMRQPAITALASVGHSPFNCLGSLRELEEAALVAVGSIETTPAFRGRPPKVEAREVEEIARQIWLNITGAHPTYTTDPNTSRRTGDWPNTLRAIYKALRIEASVDNQVRTRGR